MIEKKRIFVDLSGEVSFGLGDTITLLPAFKELRKRHPDDEIVVIGFMTGICVLAYCDYIDYLLPVDILEPGEWTKGFHITMEEMIDIINPTHSFMNHHKEHVVKANTRRVLLESPENISCDYELSIRDFDVEPIEKAKAELLKMADGKKIIGIAPCITMYSRMWPQTRWQELTDMLKAEGYFVVSLGHPDDLKIDVDFDALGLYQIRQIPHILDIFESIFVVDSGMMHIAGINQNIHITKINTGQFHAECYTPYRRGEFAWNCTIIDHNCPFMRKCFLGNTTELAINEQMNSFISRWLSKNPPPTKEDEEMLQKYICWNYCYKSSNKYMCASISAKDVFKAFKEKKSIVASIAEHPLPVYHIPQQDARDDFIVWKKSILVPGEGKVFMAIRSELKIDEILEKIALTKKLYPKHSIFMICKKEHIPTLKNCKDVFHSIPIEFLVGKMRIGGRDVFLTI